MTAMPAPVVHPDGSLTIGAKRIRVPEMHLEEIVGTGANGVVVKASHRLLKIPFAVKFWLHLRRQDTRDKIAQGIAEVKKLFEATDHRSVVPVRTAGEVAGIFYSVMDFFPGCTLGAWLKESNPLGLRRLVARRLVEDICALSQQGIYHGDLHTGNVLLDTRVTSLLASGEPKLGIIDFGTSLFSSKGASEARHWRVFTETLDRVVQPFHVGQLATSPFPDSGSPHAKRAWYYSSLVEMRHILIRLGAESLMDGEDEHDLWNGGWNGEEPWDGEAATRKDKIAYWFPVAPDALEAVRQMVNDGVVNLSEEWLGHVNLWTPPAWRTLDYSDRRM